MLKSVFMKFLPTLEKIFLKVFICIVSVLICSCFSKGECRAVVFVLNSGHSMTSSAPFNIAQESIFWATQNLSSNDEVGIVTFNDKADIIRPLSSVANTISQNFFVHYFGNSNAGAGLLSAIDMLSPKFNTQRDIILITDGEISDSQSATNFKAGLKQAQWLGISVYLIDLRHNVDPKNYREYDTVKILPINYNELLTTLRTIIQGDFHAPHISLPTNDLTSGTLNFTVPVTSPEHLKFTLFSIKPGTANFENISPNNSFQGNCVKIFDVISPTTNSFDIAIDFPQNSGLTLDVVPKVSGTLLTNSSTRFFIKDVLNITPVYSSSPDSKIFSDSFFDDKHINLEINFQKIEGVIQNGVIEVPLDDLDENISLQKIHFEDVGIIFDGDDTAQIFAPKTHYGAWLLTAAGIFLIAFLTWLIYKKRRATSLKIANLADMLDASQKILPIFAEKLNSPKNSSVNYKGKLLIYVTNLPEDEHFAPREFNLLRMHSDKIPVSYVLEECGIFGIFPSAKNIFINPDNRGISIDNQSECTITNRNVIVEKGGKISLNYNDFINIISLDEKSEVIMMYKSLKPS